MIDFVQGALVFKSPTALVVRVAGVGLRVQIPLSTYEALPKEGDEVKLLTHLHVREDELSLYGFATALERELFRMLLGVSRIGPIVALKVLSSCPAAQFKRYILDQDVDALRAMSKGIGAKTARRLVAELQEPVKHLAVAPAEGVSAGAASDAIQALVALGEPRTAAERAVKAALARLGSDADSRALVEEALSR